MDELDHLARTVLAVRAAIRDLDAPVPSCPGWTRRDLVLHLGAAHHWSRGAILDGHPRTPAPAPPEDGSITSLDQWYAGHAAELLATLRDIPPDTPCWAFGPKPATAGFWRRRQLHETVVHAVDLEPGLTIDPEVARDGIDEVVSMFFPRQVRLERIPPLRRSLAIAPDSTDDGATLGSGTPAWVLAGSGYPEHVAAVGEIDATVHGPVDALYVLLWGRIGLDDPRVTVTGDAAAAAEVLDAGIVP